MPNFLRPAGLAALLVMSAALAACVERRTSDASSDDPRAVSALPDPAGDSALATADTALSTGVGSLTGSIDSALAATARRIRPASRVRPRRLSPLADSIAEKLIFPPVTQSWFLAAARGKRMLIDIGRVDVEVRRPPSRLDAYKQAVEARTPFPVGTRFRLRGPWGADDATIAGFDTWNGRIVATIETAPLVDSLARAIEPLPATAQLVDTATRAVTDTCARRRLLPALEARVNVIRDSIELAIKTTHIPPYERLQKTVQSRSSHAAGCFGVARAIAIVTVWAGDHEWVRQQVVLVDDAGATTLAGVRDYRFKAHEAIYAMDGDGDGVDDLAVRGWGPRLGGTSVLRIVPGKTVKDPPRLERIAAGFGWENW